MQGRVWASGIVFNPEQAELFAVHLGHERAAVRLWGTPATLNNYFKHQHWNTACVPVARRDGSPGFLVITNFAVVPPGAPMPRLAGDAWSTAVRAALLTPRLRERFPSSFDWVDSGRFCLARQEVPRFIISIFKKQRKGMRITSLSPDQTDYGLWDTPKKAPSPTSTPSSCSSSSSSSTSISSPVLHSPSSSHKRFSPSDSDYSLSPALQPPTLSRARPGSIPNPPPTAKRARVRSARASHRPGTRAPFVEPDADDAGYDADVGYESERADIVCGCA
ncbi:hypothetical protein K488DRAFT_88337 [Vararia minispora EC-137]|uniref:Uncharacterized protein n=1 Tax=Vararia minispora EC-137 TaxID=1314806 RepID=A0ACB8QE38_9AGAM|nr:hypothetical protein K488DRAFT_88337 [Vararia minispora EC-137]